MFETFLPVIAIGVFSIIGIVAAIYIVSRVVIDVRQKTINEYEEKIVMERVHYEKIIEDAGKEYNKLLHQKKSSEVKIGKVSEHLAPFLNDWPYNPHNFRFLGSPIDGIQFNSDEIIFIEIKTGKSRLTAPQKIVKNLVKEGKIKFATFRISPDGNSLEIENPERPVDSPLENNVDIFICKR